MDESYRRELLDLFKAAQAAARETHVKDLSLFDLGLPGGELSAGPSVIQVAPGLTVEPLATLYRRRALGYRFLREVLADAFGTDALRQMQRLTPDGPVARDLDGDLSDMEALFRGAYVLVATQIGMKPDPSAGTAADATRFSAWADRLATDEDLARDWRMMVPVFYDVPRRKIKAWIFLGWVSRGVKVDFERKPAARVFDAAGRSVPIGRRVRLEFTSETHQLLAPVTAEVYVTRLLDREEFRAHCERRRSRSAILSGLR